MFQAPQERHAHVARKRAQAIYLVSRVYKYFVPVGRKLAAE